MDFNYEKYAIALDKFIVNTEKIMMINSPEIGMAMMDLCQVLRIAKVEGIFYDTPAMEARGQATHQYTFLDNGDAVCEAYQCREMTGGGNVAIYKIYKKNDGIDWTEIEAERVNVFEKLLFAFNGRVRVMGIAQSLMFTDRELGIPNHPFFMKTLGEYIGRGIIGNYCACFFNMKRFSIINEHVGREVATLIMRKHAGGLQEIIGNNGVVCRIGGDNFVTVFGKDKVEEVIAYLKGRAIVFDETTGERVKVSCHAGYYLIPDTVRNPAEIMDCIMNALNICKKGSLSQVFFDEELIKKANDAKYIESVFPEALKNREFKAFYQPKTNLDNYEMVGAEALCRWFRDGEIIVPFRFIPVLERGKAICKLDFYMLETVCQDIRRWIDEGKKVVPISVNFSRRHLGDVDLLERILAIIDKYNVPHEYIEIELTETTTDVDYKELGSIVEGLSEAGIITSVDDFGVGYSSLNLIRELPWNILKIDRSFIPTEDNKDSSDYVMLKHLVSIAKDMGLECIAEGVETLEQVNLLKECQCYLAQGFYFDKPLPVEVFETKL